jgi:hypothetical protein
MPYGGHHMKAGDLYIVDVGLRRQIYDQGDGYAQIDGTSGPYCTGYWMPGRRLKVGSTVHPVHTWTDSGPERGC